jgi:hypothetical protein
VKLFPNPVGVSEPIHILFKQGLQGEVLFKCLDINEVVLFQKALKLRGEAQVELELPSLPRGVFILELLHKGLSARQRFIVD